MDKKSLLKWANILILVGAINWGLVGLLRFNAVEVIFGESILRDVVYVLVGVAAVYILMNGKSKK